MGASVVGETDGDGSLVLCGLCLCGCLNWFVNLWSSWSDARVETVAGGRGVGRRCLVGVPCDDCGLVGLRRVCAPGFETG